MSGLTLKLIRTSVSEMLETLSDDDYVNVVHVSMIICYVGTLQSFGCDNRRTHSYHVLAIVYTVYIHSNIALSHSAFHSPSHTFPYFSELCVAAVLFLKCHFCCNIPNLQDSLLANL